MKGWLNKQGAGVIKSYKKRWFELRGDKLHYLKEPGGAETGIIPLKNCNIEDAGGKNFNIAGPHLPRTFQLQADSDAEKTQWIKALNESIATSATRAQEFGDDPGNEVCVFQRSKEDGGLGLTHRTKVGLEDFELVTVIGRGSFGKVMKVRLKDDPNRTPLAMKVMRKDVVIKEDMVANTKREKQILQSINHPFIVKLHYAFQTRERLYLILDLLSGGELFFHLKEEGSFGVRRALFYTAEIVSALHFLHEKLDTVYRDLKPENIVLDKDGHACLTDFGLAKTDISKQPTFTFCGTPEYLAPEILKGKGHSKGVDWWSLGCVCYEMLCGLPPFYSENVNEMYELILNKPLTFPDHVSPDARDLLTQLLQRDENKRLTDGFKVRAHPFFKDIDWEKLNRREYVPEFIPDIKGDDTRYVDEEFKAEVAGMSVVQAVSQLKLNEETFSGFTYVSKAKGGLKA
jgi:serine/threonine protein kinase